MKQWLAAIVIVLATASAALADAGVLVPTNIPEDRRADALKLRKMVVRVTVEDQHAFVSVLQLFENKTDTDLEGKYVFRIPEGAAITDFAIWEDGARIPGVILERRKARAIYENLTASKIDPGLLEQDEGEEDRNAFVARVFPIPAHGVKRIELSYEQPLEVTSLRSRFAFPLKPDNYEAQAAGEFSVRFSFSSAVPLEDFQIKMGEAKFNVGQGDDGVHAILRSFNAHDIDFTDDLSFEWKLKPAGSVLDFFTYRDTSRQVLDISPDGGQTYRDDMGYFLSRVTLAMPSTPEQNISPRDIVFALDASISMRGRKLEAAYNSLSDFLNRLNPQDRFTLILFNDRIAAFERKFVAADKQQVERALAFVREQALTGGTDLMGAMKSALELAGTQQKERAKLVVLITDGNPTMNIIGYKRFDEEWRKAGVGKARLFIFGIGNDANAELLGPVAEASDGYFTWADETEDLEFKLTTFFEKVGAPSIGNIKLDFSNPSNFTQVYPIDSQKTFAGGAVEFVGKYKNPGTVQVSTDADGVRISKQVTLPESELSRPWIRRMWAKARVAYLLHLIRFEGEKDEWIEEIIALAKEFKFVTPYTSFLAAPRALLRPRIIRPGDPILRVRTDPSVKEVTAIFPFGLIKPMRRVERDPARGDVWEVRFLAPKWMSDGTYKCALILFDDAGRGYREEKDFIIDSRPPKLDVNIPSDGLVAGAALEIKVDADPDTRWIRAALPGIPAVELRWDADLKVSRAVLPIPIDYPPGRYELTVSAEDFAHNSSARGVAVVVRGGSR